MARKGNRDDECAVKYFVSTHKTQQEKQKQLRPCGKCFATLVLAQQGVEYL